MSLTVQVFADGASLDGIEKLASNPLIAGFTTNPTLMRQAGVTDYEWFARQVLAIVPDRPISFEVTAKTAPEMERQALKMHTWGDNVYVKIPVLDLSGNLNTDLVGRLTEAGVKVNVTALMTAEQVGEVTAVLRTDVPAYVSVFAGRIADTGRDPMPIMRRSLELLASSPSAASAELIWASPREILNIVQADEIGCHVITVTHDLLTKLPTLGKNLDLFSLETVEMFHRDATAAGYTF